MLLQLMVEKQKGKQVQVKETKHKEQPHFRTNCSCSNWSSPAGARIHIGEKGMNLSS